MKYSKIWDKVGNGIKKRFHSKAVHNEKYLRTNMKCYEVEKIQIFMIMKQLKNALIAFATE